MAKLALKALMIVAAVSLLTAAIFVLARVIVAIVAIALVAGVAFLMLRLLFPKRSV